MAFKGGIILEGNFNLVKINFPMFRFIESLRHTANLMNLKKKYQLNRNKKFVDKAQQYFAIFNI